jgi:hypothetical protein
MTSLDVAYEENIINNKNDILMKYKENNLHYINNSLSNYNNTASVNLSTSSFEHGSAKFALTSSNKLIFLRTCSQYSARIKSALCRPSSSAIPAAAAINGWFLNLTLWMNCLSDSG